MIYNLSRKLPLENMLTFKRILYSKKRGIVNDIVFTMSIKLITK